MDYEPWREFLTEFQAVFAPCPVYPVLELIPSFDNADLLISVRWWYLDVRHGFVAVVTADEMREAKDPRDMFARLLDVVREGQPRA